MTNMVEAAIASASKEFVEKLSALTAEPYFREAVLKMGVREMTWAFYETFEDNRTELTEQLALMSGFVETEHRGKLPSY